MVIIWVLVVGGGRANELEWREDEMPYLSLNQILPESRDVKCQILIQYGKTVRSTFSDTEAPKIPTFQGSQNSDTLLTRLQLFRL